MQFSNFLCTIVQFYIVKNILNFDAQMLDRSEVSLKYIKCAIKPDVLFRWQTCWNFLRKILSKLSFLHDADLQEKTDWQLL